MEWTLRCTVERQAGRMHEMMKRLDVDALALVRQKNGEAYTEARTRCLSCEESVRCLRWRSGLLPCPSLLRCLPTRSLCCGLTRRAAARPG